MIFNNGDIIEDMQIQSQFMKRIGDKTHRYVICKCVVCGRDKVLQNSALNRRVGTSHRMCNHEFTEEIRKKYPEFYRCWNHIKARINNPNIKHYERYGGRGLTNDYEYFVDFCDDLLESYLEHVNAFGLKNTTIERKNNDLGYIRGNLVWATWKEQASNRCTTVNFKIYDAFTGETYRTNNLKAFCDEHDINHKAIWTAISRGQEYYKNRWKVEKI